MHFSKKFCKGGAFIPDWRVAVKRAASENACISELTTDCGIDRLRGIPALLVNFLASNWI